MALLRSVVRQSRKSMTRTETALSFVQLFSDGNLEGLKEILADNLEFRGPLLSAHSSSEYLEALEASPPVPTPFEVISVTENWEGHVAIFWDYRFYHDEAAGDGEYIVLDGELEAAGLRLPKSRAWYIHKEDRHLGTDVLVALDGQAPVSE